MIRLVISGGQTGVDQAAWRAAKACGLATGGWMPKGFLTEAGSRPDFADLYGAREHASSDYPPRTRQNVAEAEGTVWLGNSGSAGFRLTYQAVLDQMASRPGSYPFYHVQPGAKSSGLVDWLRLQGIGVVNFAGNRETGSPGIGERAERFLIRVFETIREVRL